MNFPAELKYSKSHEWVKMLDETTALVGITDYAQKELGDLVFINLPMEGDEVTKETPFCDVESVKAVSDVMSPVSGTVAEVNEELQDAPRCSTSPPMTHGSSRWRISPTLKSCWTPTPIRPSSRRSFRPRAGRSGPGSQELRKE